MNEIIININNLKSDEDKIIFYSNLISQLIEDKISEDFFINASNYFFINSLDLVKMSNNKDIINLLYSKNKLKAYKYLIIRYNKIELELKLNKFIYILNKSKKRHILKIFNKIKKPITLNKFIDNISDNKCFKQIKIFFKSLKEVNININNISNINTKVYNLEYIKNECCENNKEEIINRIISIINYFGYYILEDSYSLFIDYNDAIHMNVSALYKYYNYLKSNLKSYIKYIYVLTKLYTYIILINIEIQKEELDEEEINIKPFDKILNINKTSYSVYENISDIKKIIKEAYKEEEEEDEEIETKQKEEDVCVFELELDSESNIESDSEIETNIELDNILLSSYEELNIPEGQKQEEILDLEIDELLT
jgi:hypothetical protein